MEHLKTLLAMLPANWAHAGLEALGGLTLLHQSMTRLVPWGVPAAARAADRLAQLALASPLKPLILWQAPAIMKFLDDFSAALTQISNTFRDRLEADLKAAVAAQPPAQAPIPAQGQGDGKAAG